MNSGHDEKEGQRIVLNVTLVFVARDRITHMKAITSSVLKTLLALCHNQINEEEERIT